MADIDARLTVGAFVDGDLAAGSGLRRFPVHLVRHATLGEPSGRRQLSASLSALAALKETVAGLSAYRPSTCGTALEP